MKQTIRLEGEFVYNNGFDDKVRQKICLSWLRGEFILCDNFDAALANAVQHNP
jgi:hypothetical protein